MRIYLHIYCLFNCNNPWKCDFSVWERSNSVYGLDMNDSSNLAACRLKCYYFYKQLYLGLVA